MKHIGIFSFFALLASLSGCATTEVDDPKGGFFAIIASDADASANWYKSVFEMETAREISTERAEIVLLKGEMGFVEIIEFNPAAPDYVNRSKGIFKAGFLLPSFNETVSLWRANDITFFGNGEVFYDEALGTHSVIILDPDGNRIQAFGASTKPPVAD
ncbi:MAG: hypothetical protein DHS20C05_11770 [Hyphococcus sp.]|nr:MAG: hypothetical protein DHS20C05_11770 [Marinicaulis sp.]